MHLGSMFISNCNNALHVSDAFCVHPQEHLETVVAASGVPQKPSTLDALIVYFTPSHVINQRLLLQFLSAPEDGHYCSY